MLIKTYEKCLRSMIRGYQTGQLLLQYVHIMQCKMIGKDMEENRHGNVMQYSIIGLDRLSVIILTSAGRADLGSRFLNAAFLTL